MPGSTDIDRETCRAIQARVVTDTGAAFAVGLAYLGDRLGLFRALAESGPTTSAALAACTGLDERYVREWLHGMVAAEYVEQDADRGGFFMTAEQTAVLADESSPVFAAGAFHFAIPSLAQAERLLGLFRTGGGIPFAELGDDVALAIDRMHRPWFEHLLCQEWLPRVPGLRERLAKGIHVLDAGCGLGRSTVAVARAFPRSHVLGIDPHEPSMNRARALAAEHQLVNAAFRAVTLESLTAPPPFDLVLLIDCVHDMHNPVGALRVVRELLAADGLVVWSEPTGSDNPLENRNPAGRMRANLSPFHCLTVSLAEGGAGLGTIIGEAGARRLAEAAGYSQLELLPIASPMQQFFALRR